MKFKPGQTVHINEPNPLNSSITGSGIFLLNRQRECLILTIKIKNIPEYWHNQLSEESHLIPKKYKDSTFPAYWFKKHNISIDRKENLKLI